MSVLVVIPTLNEARVIEAVLADLRDGLPADRVVRFVVADGGSSDGTPDIIHRLARSKPELQLLHNPKRLQSAGVNLAVQAFGADADVLIRCDAHARYPSGYIRSLVNSLDANDADALVVPMDSLGDTCLRMAIAWVSNSIIGSGGSSHRGGRVSGFVDHGHHAAFRMASFVRAGGYDETFSHNEDAELDCRQRALGSRIFLDSNIRLAYYPRGTLGGLWRQYFNYGRGRSRTVRKHPGSLRLRQLAVPVYVSLIVLALLGSAWWPVLLAFPAIYLCALVVASLSLVAKHHSVCGLLAGVCACVMHVAWAAGFVGGLATSTERRWDATAVVPLNLPFAT
jgi:succinoglycan biosynthesis protein ExoA